MEKKGVEKTAIRGRFLGFLKEKREEIEVYPTTQDSLRKGVDEYRELDRELHSSYKSVWKDTLSKAIKFKCREIFLKPEENKVIIVSNRYNYKNTIQYRKVVYYFKN